MTKAEYLHILNERLGDFDKELRDEIMEDYNRHFAEGEKQGKSDEEIIRELGSIEEMIKELAEVDFATGQDKKYCYEGEYKEINLECDVADIVLEPSEDGKIQVDYKNDGSSSYQHCFTFYQHEKDGVFYAGVKRNTERKVTFWGRNVDFGNGGRIVLSVKIPRDMPLLSFHTSSGNVRAEGIQVNTLHGSTASGNLAVQKAVVEKLEVSTASGNLILAEVSGEKLEASTASGNLKASKAQAEELIFSTASGNIKMDADVEDCQCSTASGGMNICIAGKAKRVDISAASGNASLKLENADGMEADIQTMSGSVDISWAGERFKRVKGGTYRYGDGSCQVNVNVCSGRASIVGKEA